MADFTPTQGRYLAYIHAYTSLHGYPPAEAEIAQAMCVSPPSVNQMVKQLEKRGLIERQPGRGRSIQVLVPAELVPDWNGRKAASRAYGKDMNQAASRWAESRAAHRDTTPANLYVLQVYLVGGPISAKGGQVVRRDIEIRGDQTFEQLHSALFEAYERAEEQLYEFHLGKRPYDPKGPNVGSGAAAAKARDARATTLDDLGLKKDRVFGYVFDFGDEWYHQIGVDRVEQAIPTVKYPRITKRVGKAPPQYPEE